MTQRRLDLHVSALNDAEYSLYTSSLADITLADEHDLQGHDDAYFEQMTLSLREARAWFKGRYSHIPAAAIDNVLRFFSPSLSQGDNLTGGQFFAAHRLIVHAESGREVERALAFVQAHPSDRPINRPSSPPKRPTENTPRRSSDAVQPSSSNPEGAANNPFSITAPPPVHPTTSNNPFSLGRAKSNPGAPPSARSIDSSSVSIRNKLPPLPPRKPVSPPVPPPRHGSLATSSPSLVTPSMLKVKSSTTLGSNAPAIPPKPSHFAHVTSTLMKQSLQASKTGQTMKKAEEQLERERVLQVLKTSASPSASPFASASSSRNRSISPNKLSSTPSSTSSIDERDGSRIPPIPRRRKVSSPQSVSTSSFQQVALASTSSSHSTPSTNPFVRSPFSSSFDKSPTSVSHVSPSSSPTQRSFGLPGSLPPPKHPDQSNRENSTDGEINHRHKRSPSVLSRLNFAPHGSGSVAEPAADESYDSSMITPTVVSKEASMSDGSPGARLFRSKSMHHQSPPTSPFSTANESPSRNMPPPVRRKRPESFQVLPGSSGFGAATIRNDNNSFIHQRTPSSTIDLPRNDPLHLKSFAASLQPQLQQIQPKLDKARFKAEAGLSRRGFLVSPKASRRKEDQEGLMSGEERSEAEDTLKPYRKGTRQSMHSVRAVSDSGVVGWDENAAYSDSSSEGLDGQSRCGTVRGRRVGSAPGGSDPDYLEQKDHLKWPVGEGEGWTRL